MSTGGLTGGLYKPLTDQEVETIHQKALDILEQVGMGYEDDLEALDMLDRAGCDIDRHAGRIYFPRDIVTAMVAKAPREFTLYSRDGKNDLHLGQDRVYAGTGGTTSQIFDLDTGKIRPPRLDDQYRIAKLVDTLDNIHFYQSAVAPLDIPTERYDPNILFAAMMGTRKHIMFGCNFRAGRQGTLQNRCPRYGQLVDGQAGQFFSMGLQQGAGHGHGRRGAAHGRSGNGGGYPQGCRLLYIGHAL